MQRRSFLRASALATFGAQIAPTLRLRGQGAPSQKLNIAAIGCGGQGASDLNGLAGENIVALCDVDDRRAAGSFQRFPGAKRFKDFRAMFEQMAGQIDAVLVATPDHTHATASLAAIAHGKHVYCEKPLAHTIGEVRAMQRAAEEKKVITQVGNQGHSSDSIRVFCEMIWAGAVGQVTEVHAGCDAFKDVYCQTRLLDKVRAERPPVPPELDWDLWLGPAAERPYHSAYLPFNWRGWSAFGSGCIGDWVCHVLDPVFWALDLGLPSAITAETQGYDPEKHVDFYPEGCRITYEFPAKGERGPVKVIWHDGAFGIPRPEELEPNRKVNGTGAVVIGETGKIMYGSHGAGGCRLIPETRMKDFPRPEPKLERVRGGHQKDWLDAIRAGKQAGSNFAYGGALSEIGLLGMIAVRHPGVRLEWDATALRFTNHEPANVWVNPTRRAPWKT
jgi:predicted dehydrogenase